MDHGTAIARLDEAILALGRLGAADHRARAIAAGSKRDGIDHALARLARAERLALERVKAVFGAPGPIDRLGLDALAAAIRERRYSREEVPAWMRLLSIAAEHLEAEDEARAIAEASAPEETPAP